MWCLTVGGLSPWKEFSQSLESSPQYIFAYISLRNLLRSAKLWPTKKFTDICPQKLPGAKKRFQLVLCPKLSPAPRKRSAAELFRPKKGEKRLWGIGSPNQPTPSPSAVTSWSRIFRPSASSADAYLPCPPIVLVGNSRLGLANLYHSEREGEVWNLLRFNLQNAGNRIKDIESKNDWRN